MNSGCRESLDFQLATSVVDTIVHGLDIRFFKEWIPGPSDFW